MTPGNNGASTPEDDDPFGYLYEDGKAAGAQPPSGGGGYGYPGSVNRVRPVGERQYGQSAAQAAAPTAQYGQVPQQQGTYGQQGQYGQPTANYATAENHSGGASTTHQQTHGGRGGGGRGRGPNTKGLLIGAVAVVAAVVIGIAIAMTGGDSDDDKSGDDTAGPTASAGQSAEPSETSSKEAEEPAELPDIDAKALKLGAGVTTASDIEGASAAGGIYVTGLNQVGAEVTWTVNGIPKAGTYTVFTKYSVPGKDAKMTLTVNGKEFGSKLNLGNFAGAKENEWEKGWTETYSWPTLTKGTNTISISCQEGDDCDVLLDQLRLKAGQVKN
ncbi:carbohydrate-binding protein [Streptomyces sp. NPDC057620]|uniref:Carbohydrate-binding protein n=1 Tax=Streptomyces liliiviolaceus TaxID=2823109 RepID=A0A940XND5_9ACTN|nr:carbohydrate-binding protein [Streptomyces liliiviolaceus]MBQ0847442.1 carbohydrate-binding protein [Streptomyces liliiviolaceus]